MNVCLLYATAYLTQHPRKYRKPCPNFHPSSPLLCHLIHVILYLSLRCTLITGFVKAPVLNRACSIELHPSPSSQESISSRASTSNPFSCHLIHVILHPSLRCRTIIPSFVKAPVPMNACSVELHNSPRS